MSLQKMQANEDSDNLIVYYPNRRNLYALPLFMVGCIWGIWVFVEPIWNSEKIVIEHLAQMIFGLWVSLCCIVFFRVLFDSARQMLYCTDDGIHIAHDRRIDQDFIPWNDVLYVYEAKNFKGQFYLVFSKKSLNKKESKHLATKSSWLLRLHVDQAIAVWDNTSSSAQVFFLEIKKHFKVIRHF